MRPLILFVLGLAAALVLVPTTAVADSATHTYVLVMEEPNFGVAPNGDHIAISGDVDFSVKPKTAKNAEGSGSFTHTNAAGTVLATGTWEATGLVDYQSYGCGVVFGFPLPPNVCGGRVAMQVVLTTPEGELPGFLTVICVIGPNPPNSIITNANRSEGATLNVPGIINFNHTAGGDNVIIQTG
jgi:hypothetical protein